MAFEHIEFGVLMAKEAQQPSTPIAPRPRITPAQARAMRQQPMAAPQDADIVRQGPGATPYEATRFLPARPKPAPAVPSPSVPAPAAPALSPFGTPLHGGVSPANPIPRNL